MAGRGRGYASSSFPLDSSLRKPGKASLSKYTASNSDAANDIFTPPIMKSPEAVNIKSSVNGHNVTADVSKPFTLQPSGNHIFDKICDRISRVNLSDPHGDLAGCIEEVRILCNTKDNLEKWVDIMFRFALKSKRNAHAIAVFSENNEDLAVDQTKFRNLLLNKLKGIYQNRNESYKDLDSFVLDAYFACELFHHLRIKGTRIEILVGPILDYLDMLVDGGSQKEVEVLFEQLPKFYQTIAEKDPNGLENLFIKVRTKIVSDKTPSSVRLMLLELFEMSLTNFAALKPNVKQLYESNTKPVPKICS